TSRSVVPRGSASSASSPRRRASATSKPSTRTWTSSPRRSTASSTRTPSSGPASATRATAFSGRRGLLVVRGSLSVGGNGHLLTHSETRMSLPKPVLFLILLAGLLGADTAQAQGTPTDSVAAPTAQVEVPRVILPGIPFSVTVRGLDTTAASAERVDGQTVPLTAGDDGA